MQIPTNIAALLVLAFYCKVIATIHRSCYHKIRATSLELIKLTVQLLFLQIWMDLLSFLICHNFALYLSPCSVAQRGREARTKQYMVSISTWLHWWFILMLHSDMMYCLLLTRRYKTPRYLGRLIHVNDHSFRFVRIGTDVSPFRVCVCVRVA